MKNTFAVSVALLLVFAVGGSFLGYRNATHEEEPKAEASATSGAPAGETATGGTQAGNSAQSTDTTKSGDAAGTTAANPDGTASAPATAPAGNSGTTANAGTPGVDNTNAAGATGNAPKSTAAAAAANAPAGDADAGKAKFAVTCAGCHGANAEGGIGPALNIVKGWTDDQFHTALREGRAPDKTLSTVMPRFTAAQLTDAEIANIHAYLKTVN